MHTLSNDLQPHTFAQDSISQHLQTERLKEKCEQPLPHSEHLQNINTYYDSAAVQFFEKLTGQQIHLGYWDQRYPSVSLAQAARRLTTIITNLLNPGPETHLLDIGCGSGMPAIQIMQATQCRVDGITINESQQLTAQLLSKEAGLAAKSHFVLGDAIQLPYPAEYFDSTLLLESIHHIGHDQAICEAYRVLKPGGKIIIADALVMKETSATNYQQWLAETFVSKSQLTKHRIEDLLISHGFGRIEVIDLSAAIQPTWSKLMFETRARQDEITTQFGVKTYEQMLEFWSRIDYIWSSTAGYLIFSGMKL